MVDLVLLVHVVAGLVGLVGGGATLRGGRRWLRPAVELFHAAVATVCATAVVLVAFDWRSLWFFLPLAAWSYRFALRMRMHDARSAGEGEEAAFVRDAGGAYVALWTAFVVVAAAGAPWLWPVPTVAGVVMIERAARRRIEAAA